MHHTFLLVQSLTSPPRPCLIRTWQYVQETTSPYNHITCRVSKIQQKDVYVNMNGTGDKVDLYS